MPCRQNIGVFGILLVFAVFFESPLFAVSNERLGVVYSPAPEPYATIIKRIVNGIEASYAGDIVVYDNNQPIETWALEHDLNTVVALGTKSIDLCDSLNQQGIKVIAGAISSPPENKTDFTGVVMSPSPDKVMSILKETVPRVKRLHVVYWPPVGEWMIPYLIKASEEYSLPIVLYPITDSFESIKTYNAIITDRTNHNDALWLQNDTISINKDVFTDVLRKAWDYKFVLVSSNLSHVSRGVLLGLYPEQTQMGMQIAVLASKVQLNPNIAPIVEPVNALNVALHIRAANHLEIFINQATQHFDIVFPTPN